MGDMLSQEEINALLNNSSEDDYTNKGKGLTPAEKDALGEIGNISMGTSATTLFNILRQKVIITTPRVELTEWETLKKSFSHPMVAIKINYTSGFTGSNVLLLKDTDVIIMTDLMMGGDGKTVENEISDFHLSAIGEAMNQMVGSASTSMSEMFKKRIEISPPHAVLADFAKNIEGFNDGEIVKISFKMIIGELIDSEIMQIIPLSFAKEMVYSIIKQNEGTYEDDYKGNFMADYKEENIKADKPQVRQKETFRENEYIPGSEIKESPSQKDHVNIQPAHFQQFDDILITVDKKNISLIMDVPLEVTVELGRTNKMIKDILEFSPGSIIELDKLAGEPVDIMVNGKRIAKGEVVVIDESFGVRITDIVHPSKRL